MTKIFLKLLWNRNLFIISILILYAFLGSCTMVNHKLKSNDSADEGSYIKEGSAFDKNGQSDNEMGIVLWRFKYNRIGKLIEMSGVGKDGNLLEDERGVAIYRFRQSDRLSNAETTYYGVDGRLKEDNRGIAIIKFITAPNGSWTIYHGVDGNIKEDKDGVAASKAIYDLDSRMGEISNYGLDLVLKENVEGYAFEKYKVDKDGNISESSYFNINGILIKKEKF